MFLYYINCFCILFYSHPKYRAALKEKLPFLVCGSTEDPSAAAKTAAAAETSSTITTT